MTTQHQTFCRYCHAYCPMIAEVDNGKVTAVKPDTDNEMYGGYTCIKGRQLVEQMYQAERLTRCQVKTADGFTDIDSETAMDEIAAKIRAIVDEYGPRAIATYNGTVAFQNSGQLVYSREWHNALGSPSYYTSVTIDQPAKVFVGSRMGYWTGGSHFFHDSDVAMVIGNNPIASHYASPGGIPSVSPSDQIRRARKRGLKLIVIDPRKTEVANRSDIHLQLQPGTDAVLLAGMIRLILEEELYDKEFCDTFTRDLDELRAAVADYDLAKVSARTHVPADQIAEAARTFAAGPKGVAVTGTGPEMSSHPNLTQHLVASLNAICGRFYRAGDKLPNPGALSRKALRVAQVYEAPLAWERGGDRSRVRPEFGELVSPTGVREMPTSQLADEILTPGEGKIRVLFVIAGNPLMAWPDQEKAMAAMQELDLLICIDPYISATAEMAHYVFAPKLTLEREDVTLLADPWYEKPYSQYSRAIVETDHDVIEEWELYWGLAKRLGLEVTINGETISNETKPTKFELLKAITKGSRVDIGFLRDNPGGHVFDDINVEVMPAPDDAVGRLKLYPVGVAEEFEALDKDLGEADYSHVLIGFRSKYVLNSFGRNLPALKAKSGTTNPANIHPDDLAAMGIDDDAEVTITSPHGSIQAVVKANDKVKPGVIAMHHCWGVAPGEQAPVREVGANTNLLVDGEAGLQQFTGMTRSSTIPVNISAG